MTDLNYEIETVSSSPGEAWEFFSRIRDVNDLEPFEEECELWKIIVNEETVGMAMVDTFPRDFVEIHRIAIDKTYRQNGLATTLLERILDEYETAICEVHVDNTESQKLMDTVGFTQKQHPRYNELYKYEY